MTRLATAILGILVGAMVAGGLLAGCGSNHVEIGVQNADAQAGVSDVAAGSGGAAGLGSDAAVVGGGGAAGGGVVTATGGSTPIAGTPGVASSTGAGGVTRTGGTTGGATGTGGTLGSGGVAPTGGTTAGGGSAAVSGTARTGGTAGTAVSTGAGGTALGGGTIGAGGATGNGGATGAGGATPAGGTAGAGGATRTGGIAAGTGGTGGTGARCGGLAGYSCPAGEICDMLPGSCGTFDGFGTCVVRPQICPTLWQPVCGCDGKTYSSDCARISFGYNGMAKKSDGECGAADAGAGGSTGTGGTTGAGGATGTGGTGGTAGKSCNTFGGVGCSAGEFCDIQAYLCNAADASGTCVVKPQGCITEYQPVCGCDGHTYSSDCDRRAAGVSKRADGACPTADAGVADAGSRYPTAWLAWQAPGGIVGVGAAVVVSGAGGAEVWTRVNAFPPETPPSEIPTTYSLTPTQIDDLFGKLASMDLSQLPHPGTGFECYPTLYFRLCTGCAATTLRYDVPSELLPEMEPVWAWFDQLLGATDSTNPRNYCKL